ncbi:MAG: hypothetical protein GC164_01385 [Phycisphaera sp.]|nr:hypothetical protein [Phycisphaera sp.]
MGHRRRASCRWRCRSRRRHGEGPRPVNPRAPRARPCWARKARPSRRPARASPRSCHSRTS